MLADMSVALPTAEESPLLAMHRREAFDLRRPIDWSGQALVPLDRLPSPPKHEWLELVKYWNSGGRRPIWFVADPLRSDLALIHHGPPRASYRWPFAHTGLLGGIRPNVMDWYVLDRPAWYLGEGWALTPETAGVAGEDGKGPGRAAIEGWVLRTQGAATLLIGGRNLLAGGPPARITIASDDRSVEEFEAASGFFLRLLTLQPGQLAGTGDYAHLTIRADREEVAIEQFDVQPTGRPVFGFGEGWHEHEYNAATGVRWRWTSERAALRVRPEGQNLMMVLRGETDPSTDTPHVVIRVGQRVLVDEEVSGAFAIQVAIPAELLSDPDPVIVVETDQTHVPAEESWRSADRRRLGLKIFECSLTPIS
jgi:hypothetical protein